MSVGVAPTVGGGAVFLGGDYRLYPRAYAHAYDIGYYRRYPLTVRLRP